ECDDSLAGGAWLPEDAGHLALVRAEVSRELTLDNLMECALADPAAGSALVGKPNLEHLRNALNHLGYE
ncbi:unnamed protein product, partial [Prorocentrum cordatum]